MRNITRSVVCILTLCISALAQQQSATSSRDESSLRALEEKWDTASVKGDAEALATIFADSFISTSTEGKVRTRAEMLAEIKSGDIKYQSSKVDGLKVYLYGDAAVVSGRWTGKFVEKGKTIDTVERFTDTFVRQNGQWRCVASHGSAIK